MLEKRILLSTILIIVISTLLITSGCAIITGSGDLATREFEYFDFTKVEIGYAFEAEISQDDSFMVKVTLDDNLYEYLDISISFIKLLQHIQTFIEWTQSKS